MRDSTEDFKDMQQKHDAWKDIAETLKCDKNKVERWVWIGQFQCELTKKRGKSGDGVDGNDSKWFPFNHLLFI